MHKRSKGPESFEEHLAHSLEPGPHLIHSHSENLLHHRLQGNNQRLGRHCCLFFLLPVNLEVPLPPLLPPLLPGCCRPPQKLLLTCACGPYCFDLSSVILAASAANLHPSLASLLNCSSISSFLSLCSIPNKISHSTLLPLSSFQLYPLLLAASTFCGLSPLDCFL